MSNSASQEKQMGVTAIELVFSMSILAIVLTAYFQTATFARKATSRVKESFSQQQKDWEDLLNEPRPPCKILQQLDLIVAHCTHRSSSTPSYISVLSK